MEENRPAMMNNFRNFKKSTTWFRGEYMASWVVIEKGAPVPTDRNWIDYKKRYLRPAIGCYVYMQAVPKNQPGLSEQGQKRTRGATSWLPMSLMTE
jgi:hypothetical protein